MLRGQEPKESRGRRTERHAVDEAYSLSDIGCDRDLNEDRVETVQDGEATTWVVCDGMGGAAGGEFAAQLAVDAIVRHLSQSHEGFSGDEILLGALREANRIIVLRRHNPDFAGMGTTVAALRFDGHEAIVGSIGDTRAYLVRDGAVQQLTVDHTFVQRLVDEGELRPEDALNHPEAHVLTRCLGSEQNAQIEAQKLYLWPSENGDDGDIVILCTDGLYSLVPDVELGQIACSLSPQEACEKLVELARERGGYDNISVSIIPFTGMLKPHAPETARAKAKREISTAQAKPRVAGGFLRHVFFLALMSGLAAVATIAGFFLMKFLR